MYKSTFIYLRDDDDDDTAKMARSSASSEIFSSSSGASVSVCNDAKAAFFRMTAMIGAVAPGPRGCARDMYTRSSSTLSKTETRSMLPHMSKNVPPGRRMRCTVSATLASIAWPPLQHAIASTSPLSTTTSNEHALSDDHTASSTMPSTREATAW